MTIIDASTVKLGYEPQTDYAKQMLKDFDRQANRLFSDGGPGGLGE